VGEIFKFCLRNDLYSGPVGRRSSQWHDQPGSMEDQAELVLDSHRRQNDPAAGPAIHVQTRRFGRRSRSRREPRDLCVATERRRRLIEDPAKGVSKKSSS
jgi:hypothetical protein